MDHMYKTPESNLVDESAYQTVEYGSFGARLVATIIDTIWSILLLFVVGMFFGVATFGGEGIAHFLISYLLPFAIVMVFWIYKSATPGKMMLGLKIVDAETLDVVPPGRLVLRYIAYYVSMLPLMIGFLWIIWDKRKQAWHDKIAGTVVIKVK